MTVSLFPLMMHKSQPKWKYYFSCHFIAVSAWLIMKSNYKNIEKKHRIDFWIGIGTATWTTAVIGTFIGFYASDYLDKNIMIGLAILNPIYFLCINNGIKETVIGYNRAFTNQTAKKIFIIDAPINIDSAITNEPGRA